MSLLVDFLSHVLPNEGWHAAFVLETKKHFWSRGIEPLADFIARSDADGLTVYHACASFKEKSRKAEAALCAQSLWSDVDAGEGKPYATAADAVRATHEFCELVGLPEPTLVGSGSGLHLYWPLLQPLEPDVWRGYAKALRSLSQASGFRTDPVRTADIASILRPVTTTNRKRDPAVLIEAGPFEGPYRIEDFGALENVTVRESASSKPTNSSPMPALASALGNVRHSEPRYLQSISEHCGQVQLFREKLGRMSEPTWHNCLGVAAFCEDGKQLGHAWSKGDERYNEAQTNEKLSRQGRFGPTTCEKFHRDAPEICEACPHWQKIKSPISLGRRDGQKTDAASANSTSGQTATSPQSGDAELDVEILRLAGLAPALYEHERKVIAEKFGLRTAVLDKLVTAARSSSDDERQGHALQLIEVEPWPDVVDGGELLHDLVKEMLRCVVMTEDDAITGALWVLHSYAFDVFTCTPRLCITSPEKRCGKTTLLDIIGCLVNRPLAAADITGAAIFRTIESVRPTILFDEADNTFGRTAKANGNGSDILAILNSGHRFGGQVVRTVGDDHEPRVFSTYAPIVIALIGRAPGTLEDRSIHIRLRRKHIGEKVERFRSDRTQSLHTLARHARRWCDDHRPDLTARDPDMPAELFNRAADNWRPLLAIADVIGGVWPTRARGAAVHSGALEKDEGLRVMLLADIRSIFQTKKVDRISSDQLVADLCKFEERPWLDYKRGHPINKHQVARLLEHFGICPEPEAIRFENGERKRGYLLSVFEDAFARYLPAQTVTTCQTQ